ncbi:MAG: PIN domain-containing protein [Solirubrobacteraceae bacterium]
MIVLDTNVVSELMRPAPDARVIAWLRGQADDSLYTTAITLAEIRYGIERLQDGQRKTLLRTAADQVFGSFERQVLPFDARAARQYAEVVSKRDRLGRPISGFDAQIASICIEHEASLATRNSADFEHAGISLINPWDEPTDGSSHARDTTA